MQRLEKAWLDEQYDNGRRVPDFADFVARWDRASSKAREGLAHWSTLPYGDADEDLLDLFLPPEGIDNAPVLIYIHGGYWRSRSKDNFSFVAPSFVAEGCMVAIPDYPLCPTVTMETIAMQTAKAIAWVWRHAAQHGGDPNRIAVVGHSAGGHLAAMMLSCRWKDVDPDMPEQPLTGAMGISGLYDLEPLRHTSFLQSDLKLTPTSVKRLSPAFFPRSKKPLYAVVGADESEEFIRQNQLIRDQWGPTSVPVCETLPGAHHFSVLKNLVDPQGRLHHLALRLLGKS